MKLIMRHDPFFSLNPIASVSDLRRDVSRLFDFAFPAFGRSFAPDISGNVDLYRVGEKFVLRAELPGISKDQIGVDVVDGKLVLSVSAATEKPAVAEATQVSTDGSEVPSPASTEAKACDSECGCSAEKQSEASYTRSFKLPAEVDSDKISARYENGVLTVELPHREQVKPRSVNIVVD